MNLNRAESPTWQPGDILACYGVDRVGLGIRLVTGSLFAPRGLRFGPSHVGIVCDQAIQWGVRRVVVESTTLAHRKCLKQAEFVAGVQCHYPGHRVNDYVSEGGHVAVYRLSAIDTLTTEEERFLSGLLNEFFGRGYDTGGACLSGSRVFNHARWFPGQDLDTVFCSELIAAVLMRLGRLTRENPTRFHPARLLRKLVREGTYERIREHRR